MAPTRHQVVVGQGLGYESPTEEDHQFCFTTPTPTSTDGVPGVPVPRRPPVVQRSSYIAAIPPGRETLAPTPTPTPGRMSAQQIHGSNLSLNNMIAQAVEKMAVGQKIGIRDRIACYQWTYFTMTMATGGLANVIHSLAWQPAWLTGVGRFFFLLNIVLFLINCIMLSTRFYLRPGSFMNSFTDQVETLFIPAFVVSIAIIMINICQYGVPYAGSWLLATMEIMFWIYVALSVFASAGLYLILWSTLVFPVHMMTPTWVFPAYPLLLTAPLASNLISVADSTGHPLAVNAIAVAFCAVTTQGTGCLIAFMISAAFVYRLMTQKLPRDMQRPGVFISIGPFGFTAAGIAKLGSQAKTFIPDNFLDTPHTASTIKIVAVLVALWLWGLAMWFFLVSVGSLWKYVRSGHRMPFQMTWWSFVFPNTALVTATQVMGEIFDSRGIKIFGAVMTAALIFVWVCIFITMVYCIKAKKLLWPKNTS